MIKQTLLRYKKKSHALKLTTPNCSNPHLRSVSICVRLTGAKSSAHMLEPVDRPTRGYYMSSKWVIAVYWPLWKMAVRYVRYYWQTHSVIITIFWLNQGSCGLMMTCWHGLAFGITGPLWGESTWEGYEGDSSVDFLHKGTNVEVFFAVSWSCWTNDRVTGDLRRHGHHVNVSIQINHGNSAYCVCFKYTFRISWLNFHDAKPQPGHPDGVHEIVGWLRSRDMGWRISKNSSLVTWWNQSSIKLTC